MKKRFLFIPILLIALLVVLFTTPVQVKAEEVVEPETTETQPAVEKKEVEDIIIEIANKYLGDYVDKQLIANIVTVASAVIGYISLLIVSIKYGKYKKNITDTILSGIQEEDGKHLKTELEKSDKKVEVLTEAIKELQKGYDVIVKALILSQDSTAKGKVTLLEYLGTKTDNPVVQEAKVQVKAEIEKQEEIKQEVNEKVSGEYTDIF